MLRIAAFAALIAIGGAVPVQEPVFKDIRMSVQNGEKSEMYDVSLRFSADALVVSDQKKAVVRSLAYPDIKSMEYSYAKSPRWKSAIFVSPLFLFSSGKKHWLMVQGSEAFAVLQLDKSNYRLIIAELEAKTGKKVETVGEK